jgi:hypothetical protein
MRKIFNAKGLPAEFQKLRDDVLDELARDFQDEPELTESIHLIREAETRLLTAWNSLCSQPLLQKGEKSLKARHYAIYHVIREVIRAKANYPSPQIRKHTLDNLSALIASLEHSAIMASEHALDGVSGITMKLSVLSVRIENRALKQAFLDNRENHLGDALNWIKSSVASLKDYVETNDPFLPDDLDRGQYAIRKYLHRRVHKIIIEHYAESLHMVNALFADVVTKNRHRTSAQTVEQSIKTMIRNGKGTLEEAQELLNLIDEETFI